MGQQLCRHQGCTCAAKSDGFCSQYCANHDAGAAEENLPCACGHDECDAPSKYESKNAFADLAPEGRVIGERPARDW
jgi:hypothetical protein